MPSQKSSELSLLVADHNSHRVFRAIGEGQVAPAVVGCLVGGQRKASIEQMFAPTAEVAPWLDGLNDRQRMAVLLNKFEHLSYAEIGDVMELSVPAVKSLLSRARNRLRDILQPYLQMGQKVDASQVASEETMSNQ